MVNSFWFCSLSCIFFAAIFFLPSKSRTHLYRLTKDAEVKRRELVKKLEGMHELSWSVVGDFVNKNWITWAVSTHELGDQTILPQLLPWCDQVLSEATFNRVPEEEGYLLFINMPTCGVVPSQKLNYFLQLTTTFLATNRKNSVCVMLFPNKASTERKSDTKMEKLSHNYL